MKYAYPAPAKLNLFLHVVGRRGDGYHLLQSVFRLIDRADTVHLELRDDGRVVREGDLPGVPENQDLTVRAARLLQAHAPAGVGVGIRLDKVLPMGGGLGGGSSDAATVLLALNRLWQINLSRQALQNIALQLGADVPVFVFGQTAFARGGGRDIAPGKRAIGLVCGADAIRAGIDRLSFCSAGIDTQHACPQNSALFRRHGS